VDVVTVACVEAAGLVSWCRAVASVWACSAVMFLSSYCAVVTVTCIDMYTVLCRLAVVQLELYFV